MSSRSWLSYYYQNRFHLTPLSYEALAYASGFSSEQCPEGVVAISENTLRILALEKLGAAFNQVEIYLFFCMVLLFGETVIIALEKLGATFNHVTFFFMVFLFGETVILTLKKLGAAFN